MSNKSWSQKEEELLKKHYPDSHIDELCDLFGSRSRKAINRKAQSMGLKKDSSFYREIRVQMGDKMKENPLKDYVGKDKLRGRPIRLNRKTLKLQKGKDYSEVIFFGDVHYGARECAAEKAKAMLDYCYDHNIYIFLMGDLLESGLKTSVGASVYRQTINPQKQLEDIEEFLKPLAEKDLILGALDGNHEIRIEKATGVNITKLLCRMLDIPYLESACWNLFRVGKQNYTVYTLHGSTGSRFIHTKLKALADISHSFDADLLCMGHVHSLADTAQLVQQVNMRNKTVEERRKHLLLTGSYLEYEKSYVQERGYPLSKLGSPKVKFLKDKKKLYISY